MTMALTVGSLFSGIGGFELWLERTGGFKVEWLVPQCAEFVGRCVLVAMGAQA